MSFRVRAAGAATLIVSAALAALSVAPLSVSAQQYPNRVEMQNKTRTAGVWVSVYKSSNFGATSNIGAFCVEPGKRVEKTYYSTIYEVRAEVTERANCTGTRFYDGLRGYPDGWNHVGHYYVTESGNKFVFGNT